MLDALLDAMPGGCLKHGQQTVLVFSFNHLVKFQGKHRVVVISGFAGSDWPHACWVPLSRKWEMKGSVGPWNGPAGDQSQWD